MTLEKLIAQLVDNPTKDPSEDLRLLRDAFAVRMGRISEAELAAFADLVVKLLQQVPLIERMAFARQLAKNRNTPRDLLSLLANDHYLVSAPVLESAPMLTEVDLAETISRHGASVCLAIAKRDALSIQMTDQLMTHAEPKMQLALAANTTARLSRKTIATLVEQAGSDAELLNTMLRRRDLPHAVVSQLKSPGKPVPVPTEQVSAPQNSAPGRGRAGIVLSADVAAAKPQPKPIKVIRYS